MKNLFRLLIITVIILLCQWFNSEAQTKVFNKDRTKSWWVSDKPGFASDTANYKYPQPMIADSSVFMRIRDYDTIKCYYMVYPKNVEFPNNGVTCKVYIGAIVYYRFGYSKPIVIDDKNKPVKDIVIMTYPIEQ